MTATYGGSSNMSINGLLGAAGVIAWNGVRLSYLKMNNTVIEGTTFQGLQLDHNSVNLPCGDDHFFTSGASAGNIGYTNNSIHDNIVELCQVNDGSGHGSDGFQWIENVSYYNNVLFWQFNGTANGQHADGIQTSGSYVAIYDNYFENAGNYESMEISLEAQPTGGFTTMCSQRFLGMEQGSLARKWDLDLK